jgi:hypothetical protein
MSMYTENIMTLAEFVFNSDTHDQRCSPGNGFKAHTGLINYVGLLELVSAAAKRFPEAQMIKTKLFTFAARLRNNARTISALQLAQRDE